MYSYLVCDVVMTLNKRGVAVLMEMGEKKERSRCAHQDRIGRK